MLNYDATIERNNENVNLILNTSSGKHILCLTDDNPGDIKAVFNKIILELKKGKFNFSLLDDTQDLFYHICNEYINQLNAEIADVYSQLKKHNLAENIIKSAD